MEKILPDQIVIFWRKGKAGSMLLLRGVILHKKRWLYCIDKHMCSRACVFRTSKKCF